MVFSRLPPNLPLPPLPSDAPSEWIAYRALLQDFRAINNIFAVGLDALLSYEIDAYLAVHPYPHVDTTNVISSPNFQDD